MTGNVTSIVQARAAARKRADRSQANVRASTAVLVTVGLLLVLGLGATMSASSVVGIAEVSDSLHFFKRQLVGVVLGVVTMLVAIRVPYQVYRAWAGVIFVVVVGLLVAVLAIGETRGGSTRWIELGIFSFQPSELAKLGVIVALAAVMARKERLIHDLGHFLAPVLATVGVVGLLLMIQPDLGTSIVVTAAALAVLMTSRAPLRHVVATGLLAVVAATVLAFTEDYRRARITGFLDPWADPLGDGFQLIQSYLALGTGGLFGVGLGASRARWFFLPNAHTDFIFAVVGEEMGLIGGLIILLLFMVLTMAGMGVARRAPDCFGRMVAAGITAWISVQALVNIGGVVGVLPITGIVLPFVSFGSTAQVATLGAVGVLVNIAHQGKSSSDRGGAGNHPLRRWGS